MLVFSRNSCHICSLFLTTLFCVILNTVLALNISKNPPAIGLSLIRNVIPNTTPIISSPMSIIDVFIYIMEFLLLRIILLSQPQGYLCLCSDTPMFSFFCFSTTNGLLAPLRLLCIVLRLCNYTI